MIKDLLNEIQLVNDAVDNLDEFSVYHGDIFNEELHIIHQAIDLISKKAKNKEVENYLKNYYSGGAYEA